MNKLNNDNKFVKIICFFIISNITLYLLIVIFGTFIRFEFTPNVYDISKWNAASRTAYLFVVVLGTMCYTRVIFDLANARKYKYGN